MKIVLTGSGSGGHFYPLIAVADAIQTIAKERKLLPPELYHIAPRAYDERLLFEHNIEFRRSPAGKVRRYFSLLNIFDTIKTAIGVVRSIFLLYSIYPDVIFSKGGYDSFPVVLAGRLLRIPIVIHESDAHPGRANLWAAKFARSIAVSYPDSVDYFPKEKVALTGNPIRAAIARPSHEGAFTFLNLEENVPVILIIGGSQGAQKINDTVLDMLPDLVKKYQILHQTGKENFTQVKETAQVILGDDPHVTRYHAFPYFNELALRMAAGAADLVVSRAGSNSIFEIATWGLPSIVIPIPEAISHDQRKNAYAFARTEGTVVVEQHNLSPHLLLSEIDRLMADPDLRAEMGEKARTFARPDAAATIATELIEIALEHEEQ